METGCDTLNVVQAIVFDIEAGGLHSKRLSVIFYARS